MARKCGWWFLVLLVLPFTAQAAGFDATIGPSFTAGARSTAAAFGSAFGEPPAGSGFWHVEPIGTIGWIKAHGTHVQNLHHSVFLAGGGARIDAGAHWFLSEQVAATSTRTDALSSRFEFMTSAGWQAGHFIVMVRHISNGRLIGGGKNLGETMLLAGIRW